VRGKKSTKKEHQSLDALAVGKTGFPACLPAGREPALISPSYFITKKEHQSLDALSVGKTGFPACRQAGNLR
jgi:hypothetical protein